MALRGRFFSFTVLLTGLRPDCRISIHFQAQGLRIEGSHGLELGRWWRIYKADEDLIFMVLQVARGALPAGVFADWLEEHEERYFPLIQGYRTGFKPREAWDGVLKALRSLESVPTETTK